MADIVKLKQALNAYTGDNETLNRFVDVAVAELGTDWVQNIFEVLADISTDEQSRLDYLYRHYAAVAAWNEAQSYLMQDATPDRSVLAERIEVLAHWLGFYQDAGTQLVDQLRQKLATLPETPVATDMGASEPEPSDSADQGNEKTEASDSRSDSKTETEETPVNSKALWAVEKIRREVEMTKELQAWVAARCVGMGNKEVMTYPYYGLVVDVMRQTHKQIQSLLDSSDMLDEISRAHPNEIKELQDYQLLLDKDIEVATQNGLDQDLDLLGGLSVEEVKKILGQLDTSNTKEESEPAPDGFVPILDTDSDLDEQSITEEYRQIENGVVTSSGEKNNSGAAGLEKNTSQTAQNGVKKKLSFSLGNKKPSGT